MPPLHLVVAEADPPPPTRTQKAISTAGAGTCSKWRSAQYTVDRFKFWHLATGTSRIRSMKYMVLDHRMDIISPHGKNLKSLLRRDESDSVT